MKSLTEKSLEWWGNLSKERKYKLESRTRHLRNGRSLSWQNLTAKQILEIYESDHIRL